MSVTATDEIKSVQLDLNGQPALPKRATTTKQPTTRLVRRDLDLLTAIHDCGGVLTTVLVALLFWAPDLKRRLVGWGSSPQQVQAWLEQFSPAHLDRQIELLKWGQKLSRLRTARVTKQDRKLVEWLHGLAPAVARELVGWLDAQAAVPPAQWLVQAIETNPPPPQAFRQRPRNPSEFVSSACKKRLQYLQQAGLIQPYDQPMRRGEGRAQTCWYLTRKGAAVVAQAKGVDLKTLDFKPAGAYGLLHLSHRLAINEFRIAMHLQAARKGYAIHTWLDDNQLRKLLAKETVTLTRLVRDRQTGERQEVAETHGLKVPDSYFVLDINGTPRHCFLELDNQTLTLAYTQGSTKDYAGKIRLLTAFYKSRYKEIFPEAGDSMWLLTVTTGSDERLRHLKATTEGVVGKQNKAADRYWFTTTDLIPLWEDFFSVALFEAIWLRGGDDRRWALDEQV
jgi:hypothetical protein